MLTALTSHGLGQWFHGETRCVSFDNEQRNLLRRGLGKDEEVAGDVGVGDEPLVTVYDVVVAIAGRCAAEVDSGPMAGFGQSKRNRVPTVDRAGQDGIALFGTANLRQRMGE